jgi:hypothetical protein
MFLENAVQKVFSSKVVDVVGKYGQNDRREKFRFVTGV